MTTQEQDKLWNDLSEESQAAYREKYQRNLTDSKNYIMGDDLDKDIVRSQTIVAELRNLFGSHNLNPKPLTYEDIERELMNAGTWVLTSICASKQMLVKLSAIYKLLMVAKYLNGDWEPDWEDERKDKWGIYYDYGNMKLCYINEGYNCHAPVYFRTKELAEQAIQILGEETIKLALTTNF